MRLNSITSYGSSGTYGSSSTSQAEAVSQKRPELQQTSSASSVQSAAVQDTVKLSAAAQAHLLKKQGLSVTQIANQLALTTKTVNDYLGITTSSATSGANAAALALLE